MYKWKKLSNKVLLANPYFKVRIDKVLRPNGKKGTYNLIDAGPSVFIVPLTAKNEIYLIGLHRYTTRIFSWKIPAGHLETETPLQGAKRELHEETGLVARRWSYLGRMQMANSMSIAWGYCYAAHELVQTKQNQRAEEGISHLQKVSIKKLFSMINRGQFTDAQSVAAVMYAIAKFQLI